MTKKCSPSIEQIKNKLMNAKTVCTDATHMTDNGDPCYIRNSSTVRAVLYTAMEKKNLNALNAISFLANFAGTLEHDHETALYYFGSAHGECNIHLLRYLKKNVEETSNCWAITMTALLHEMNRERKVRISNNRRFTVTEIQANTIGYDRIPEKGRNQNKKHKLVGLSNICYAIVNKIK